MSKSKAISKTDLDKSPSSPALLSQARFIKDLQEKGASIYEVGGSLRDHILNRDTKDYDLVVAKLPFEIIKKILKNHGSVSLVGKSFGIIKFDTKELDYEFDIALPRKEKSTGVGHRDFEVDFDPNIPIEDDLKRRDFTINAMAREIGHNSFIDPHHGKKDLKEKLIRTVSTNSFEEDPLRLLRAVQFSARFDFKVEKQTLQDMKKYSKLIHTITSERISEEILKLFSAKKPSKGFTLMKETGLLKEVFPELEATINVEQGNKIRNDDVFKHIMRVFDASSEDNAIDHSGDLNLMLASLYHDVGKSKTKRFFTKENKITFYGHQIVSKRMFQKRFKALKMLHIGADVDEISCLIENHMFQTKSFFTDKAIRRFINQIGKERIFKLIDLRIADNRGGKYPDGIKGIQKLKKRIIDEIEKEPPFSIKDLAINGHDIMALGLVEGPDIGLILHHLLDIVLDHPEKNDKETLLSITQTYLQSIGKL